jgi:hypothetical protein
MMDDLNITQGKHQYDAMMQIALQINNAKIMIYLEELLPTKIRPSIVWNNHLLEYWNSTDENI